AAHFAEATDDRALRACTRSLRGFVRFGAGELSRGLADLEAGAAGLETLSAAEEARLTARLAPDVALGAQTRALLLSWVGRYAEDDLDWRRDLQRQAEAGFERAGGMVSSQAVRAVRLPLLSLEGHWLEALETGHAAWAVRESGEAWWDRVTAPVLATIALARG